MIYLANPLPWWLFGFTCLCQVATTLTSRDAFDIKSFEHVISFIELAAVDVQTYLYIDISMSSNIHSSQIFHQQKKSPIPILGKKHLAGRRHPQSALQPAKWSNHSIITIKRCTPEIHGLIWSLLCVLSSSRQSRRDRLLQEEAQMVWKRISFQIWLFWGSCVKFQRGVSIDQNEIKPRQIWKSREKCSFFIRDTTSGLGKRRFETYVTYYIIYIITYIYSIRTYKFRFSTTTKKTWIKNRKIRKNYPSKKKKNGRDVFLVLRWRLSIQCRPMDATLGHVYTQQAAGCCPWWWFFPTQWISHEKKNGQT